MPYQYVRDDQMRRIRLTMADPVTAADLMESVDRQLSEDTWTYQVLVDSRGVTRSVSLDDIRTFLAHIQHLVAQHGPRGAVAMVARGVKAVASAQMYALLGAKVDPLLEVFWDISEAERWLDEQQRVTS